VSCRISLHLCFFSASDLIFSPFPVSPHGASTAEFLELYSTFVLLGYAVLYTNYRGSTGYGQRNLDSLPGHVGQQDVNDVMALLDQTLDVAKIGSRQKVAIFGGSHGGFLAAHLSGQFPDRFVACVMRNPVTSLAAMATITDIADWCFVEAGVEMTDLSPYALSTDVVEKMNSVSPIQFAPTVRCPTLVLLGDKDLRVPPEQGRLWHDALRSAGHVKTKLLRYPDDGHPLASVACAADNFMNAWQWIQQEGLGVSVVVE